MMNINRLNALYLNNNPITLNLTEMKRCRYLIVPLLARMVSSLSLCFERNCIKGFHSNVDGFPNQRRAKYRKRGTYYPYSAMLFGSKVGSPIDGEIYIENQQSDLSSINLDRIRTTISKIRHKIGYNTYDVSLFLINDRDMKETNYESRGINEPTDILSFPFHEAIIAGEIQKPQFDIPEYYQLGDMLIDVPYVMRRTLEDQEELKQQQQTEISNHNNNKNIIVDDNIGDDIDDDEDERGVSGAMKNVSDPEDRINMLLIHGILHLIGYDHETDDDYQLMVKVEEELLEELFPNNPTESHS